MSPLRVVFMGTAEIACPALQALLADSCFQVGAVVTQPDRPKGRALKLQPSPVKALAAAAGLEVWQPERARDRNFVEQLRNARPDLVVVVAYGQILPKEILDLPPFGCLNVHTSLLPRHRGAAPIQWALLNGDSETGVTVMKMDPGLDTGDILAMERTLILPEDDSETLHARLGQLGANLLARTIPDYVDGAIQPQPQPAEGGSYARKITREDGLIDWQLPASAVWNRVRGLVPWPGAFTYLPGNTPGRLLKVWRSEPVEQSGPAGEVLSAGKSGIVVGCGTQALRLLVLQREGGRQVTAQQLLAGNPLKPGLRLARA